MKSPRLKIYTLIALMVVLGCTGDMFLSLGMKQIGGIQEWDVSGLASVLVHTATSAPIWLGILLLLGFFVCFLTALSWADFSYLKPAMAVSYPFVTFLAHVFLGETVTATRWTSVALICLGSAMVGLTRPRTTKAATERITEPVAEHAR
jgi:drug/metabolite transporter (DMT)-like permease